MDNAKMQINSIYPPVPRRRLLLSGILIAVLAALSLVQPACSKKSKTEPVVTSPVRVVLLPFNVPAANKDLHWAALAAPILLAKAGQQAKDLDIIPIWEAMPAALSGAGASRTLTNESAANVAAWLSAKWAVIGELAPSKRGVSVTIDFIPTRGSLIPFRYVKIGKIDTIGADFPEAYNQFLRYLVARPLEPARSEVTMTSLQKVAEAVDREYGWFMEAEPGKAQDAVTDLLRSDEPLARSLFSPSLYPSLAGKK